MPFLKLQSTDVTLHYQVVGGLDAQRLDSAKPASPSLPWALVFPLLLLMIAFSRRSSCFTPA